MQRGRRGHAIVEFAMFMPWIVFLLIGAFDWGYYAWALIATQNAARAAAMYTSSNPGTVSDSKGACLIAGAQLAFAPNIAASALVESDAGVGNGSSACNASPLTVTATSVTGPDSQAASLVTVVYSTPTLIPIPGLANQLTITRTCEMRVRASTV
jgi:Flp pilus assembly protein TadG